MLQYIVITVRHYNNAYARREIITQFYYIYIYIYIYIYMYLLNTRDSFVRLRAQ
jgi:hypothetical protein